MVKNYFREFSTNGIMSLTILIPFVNATSVTKVERFVDDSPNMYQFQLRSLYSFWIERKFSIAANKRDNGFRSLYSGCFYYLTRTAKWASKVSFTQNVSVSRIDIDILHTIWNKTSFNNLNIIEDVKSCKRYLSLNNNYNYSTKQFNAR